MSTGPEIAIVGSGPSGFFAAEAILKSDARPRVHMFERLPTPFGLVRSGVAPDHQQIKQVAKVFDKISKHVDFSFFGNVEIGRDITLAALRARYDAVVLAYGASWGAPLAVPGANLPQSLTATAFIGWYNGHPDFAGLTPSFDHETAIVVGHGNVAIDIARILLSGHARLAKTDIADHALEALRHSRIRNVRLVGRRGPAQAAFTSAELRELLAMPDVRVVIDPAALQFDAAESAFLDLPANAAVKRNVALLQDALARPAGDTSKDLHVDFLASPLAIEGSARVDAVRFARNRLQGPPGGKTCVPSGDEFSIPAGLSIASIGFRGRPLDGVPFDGRRGIVPNFEGRVDGKVAVGVAPLYVAGWIKRGANGVIGTNRADAAETARSLMADLQAGLWPVKTDAERVALSMKQDRIDFAGWKLIDEAECRAGCEAGRPRRKMVDIKAMLETAGGTDFTGKLVTTG